MIKTHNKSRFRLKTLEGIENSAEIILQIEKTDSIFNDSKKPAYLCEVVDRIDFLGTPSVEDMAKELIKVNSDNRTLRRQIARLEAQLRK